MIRAWAPVLLAIGPGLALVVAGLRRRPAPAAVAIVGGALVGARVDVEAMLASLPGDVVAEEVFARVTGPGVSVYAPSAGRIRLRGVWRWSRLRGQLVPHDRSREWSPEWTRPFAVAAWAAQRRAA